MKRALVMGRSLVIGRPAAMLLMHKNATVTVSHRKTVDTPSVAREADIVIVAIGEPETVGAEYFRPGQVVVDVVRVCVMVMAQEVTNPMLKVRRQTDRPVQQHRMVSVLQERICRSGCRSVRPNRRNMMEN